MSLKHLVTNYAAYNLWAQERIVHWLSGLDEEQMYRSVPSSYPNLDHTVQHMARAQLFWLKFICGEDTSGMRWRLNDGQARESLNELLTTSADIKERFSAFSEDDLSQVLHLDTRWAKNSLPRYEYILHVINHSSYHRGQIITMARTLGITEGLVNTDYNMFRSLSFQTT